eukprot:TRINITY_DN5277_c0_g1_i2.p1 TRINITY_DN5277_c0_g1~~TRINITY_DN5277_c0_g1_i2.p1  ORF type:complete len:694 (+),score=67.16 TRINITY_DN5277_c0_g1_i2:191-2083(+)
MYTYIDPVNPKPPAYGHYTVVSADAGNGQYLYTADDDMNINRILGYPNESIEFQATFPKGASVLDTTFYVTAVPQHQTCNYSVFANIFRPFEEVPGTYLYYFCYDDNGQYPTEYPYNFTTSPMVIQVGTYMVALEGTLNETVAFFIDTTGGFPNFLTSPGEVIQMTVDLNNNIYVVNSTHLSQLQISTSAITVTWSNALPAGLCRSYVNSCFMNLDVGTKVIYVYGGNSTLLYAFDATGQSVNPLWTVQLESFPVNFGALNANESATVLVLPLRTYLQGVNLVNRTAIWKYSSANNFLSNVIVDGQGLAYVFDSRATLAAVVADTGVEAWLTMVYQLNGQFDGPSLSIGVNGTLVASIDNAVYVLQPSVPIFPDPIYPYYPMNQPFFRSYDIIGYPASEPLFSAIVCDITDSAGNLIGDDYNGTYSVVCKHDAPITATKLELSYTINYNAGTPDKVRFALTPITPLYGVGIISVEPEDVKNDTEITITGVGFQVCSDKFPPSQCLCGFGNSTNFISQSPATVINNTTMTCKMDNAGLNGFSKVGLFVIFPSDPALNTPQLAFTSNPDVPVYLSRPSKKNHTAAIVVPIVVILVLIVLIAGGVFFYMRRKKRSEYETLGNDASITSKYSTY